MKNIKYNLPFNYLSAAVVASSTLCMPLPVNAVTFNVGEIEGQLDSSLSVGASWSMQSPDKKLIGVQNGGTAASATADDGRLNFRKGETFSKIFRGMHDLELKYGDAGVFLRGKYWYDFELKDGHQHLYDIDDAGRKTSAKSSGYQLLDAFVYKNYTLAEMPGSVRVGKQVVSWGEGIFIQGGINSINPIDVSAFRRPGAELKEGLIPVNMLYVSQGISDNLSAEAFYQLEWDQTVLDNCGTFFSTSDTVAEGCNKRFLSVGSDFAPDAPNHLVIPRGGDRDPRNSGQYGVALRWFSEALNSTEFGLYMMNYHSRTPFFSTTVTTENPLVSPGYGAGGATYFFEYPEDIHLYGLSFSTTIGGASVSGELSYRPNQPLQINDTDMTFATFNGGPFLPTQIPVGAPGDYLKGYVRKPVTQAQVAVVQTFDQVFGASRLVTIGEVGYNHISSIHEGDGDHLRFGRDSNFGMGDYTQNSLLGANLCQTLLNSNPKNCNSHGFYTQNSWGYRFRASIDYENFFPGLTLTPSVSWSHDVDGYGPNFNEGSKAISYGVDANFLNTYSASLSYTDFFGGRYNTSVDRDFASLNFGVKF